MGKGMVALALLLVAGGIAYVLIRRPTVAKSVTGPSTSNQVYGVLGTLGSKLIGAISFTSTNKVAPPSGITGTQPIVNEGTYDQGPAEVQGNTLVNDAGQTLTYGTD